MKNIVLLHGAIGACNQLEVLESNLSKTFSVHRLDFSGHGNSHFSNLDFSINQFAIDVLNYLNKNKIVSASVFGYSMGGYVALYLAKHYPDRVEKIITLATKFKWDETIAAREINMLKPEKIEEKLPAFAGILRSRHELNGWKKVLKKTAELLIKMGKVTPLIKTDFILINHRVLLLLGENDKMVSQEETEEIFNLLPNAEYTVLPGTPHPIESVNHSQLADKISFFIEQGSPG